MVPLGRLHAMGASMGILYRNLDDSTRRYMVEEVERDGLATMDNGSRLNRETGLNLRTSVTIF